MIILGKDTKLQVAKSLISKQRWIRPVSCLSFQPPSLFDSIFPKKLPNQADQQSKHSRPCDPKTKSSFDFGVLFQEKKLSCFCRHAIPYVHCDSAGNIPFTSHSLLNQRHSLLFHQLDNDITRRRSLSAERLTRQAQSCIFVDTQVAHSGMTTVLQDAMCRLLLSPRRHCAR